MKSIVYWQKQLSGLPSISSFSVDRPRAYSPKLSRQSFNFSFSPQLTKSVQEFCERESISSSILISSAFSIFLSRHSASPEAVFGFVFEDKLQILRVGIEQDLTFLALIKKVQRISSEAVENGLIPFGDIVSAVNPDRAANLHPLFQVVLGFSKLAVKPEMTLTRLISIDQNKLDLSLFLCLENNLLQGVFNYSPELYESSTIQLLAARFEVLLEGVVANPKSVISKLPLLANQEIWKLNNDFNNTIRPLPKLQTIHQLFEECSKKNPKAIAISFQGESLTYETLNERSNQLANYLKFLGVGPDVLVAVLVERSLEMIIGLLAILKAGGAYVPLDAKYPEERLKFILEDTKALVVLTAGKFKDTVSGLGFKSIALDQDSKLWSTFKVTTPINFNTTENLAYVIYTSGSTGQPKGCCVKHSGVVRLTIDPNYAVLNGSQTFLQNASISFDAATFEIWGALLNGAKLIIAKPNILNATELGLEIKYSKVKTLLLTTSVFNLMIEEAPESLLSVEQLLVGGEALSANQVNKAITLLPKTQIINVYGPTEDTTFTTTYSIKRKKYDSVPIGSAINNTQVFVLDSNFQPVPMGVEGELYTSGLGLARGYLNRPELTDQRFFETEIFGKLIRVYKTGDIVRWLPEGVLEYIGRSDFQVKVRGFRIELGEIESCIRTTSGVRDVCVIVREDIPNDKRIVAYVVPEASHIESHTIKENLLGVIPEYMVPSAFVMLSELPLNQNGKIDRKVLPMPVYQNSKSAVFVEAKTSTEVALAKLICALVGIDKLSMTDNILKMGGHSLLLMQLSAKIRRNFKVHISLQEMMEVPDIAALAKLIESQDPVITIVGKSIPIVPRDTPLPLSHSQERLWLVDQIETQNTGKLPVTYVVPFQLQVKGRFDRDCLALAVNDLIARQESFRTSFVQIEGQPFQMVQKELNFIIPFLDLSHLSERDRLFRFNEELEISVNRGFDLSQVPLFRMKLLKLKEDEHTLLVNSHHIVNDGWSLGIFLKEFGDLYLSRVKRIPRSLVPLSFQCADFASWLRQKEREKNSTNNVLYWQKQLAGLPPLLNLPLDRTRPKIQNFVGHRQAFVIPEKTLSGLKKIGRKVNATLFMTLASAFSVFLSRHSGQQDIAFGFPVANRDHLNAESLIGLFANVLVLRVELDNQKSFSDLVEQVKQRSVEALSNQDVPFEQVVNALNPERSQSYSPLFQVLFQFLESPNYKYLADQFQITLVEDHARAARFDLTLMINEIEGQLDAAFVYNADLFDFDTISRFSERFNVLLESIVNDESTKIRELNLLTKKEIADVQNRFNRSEVIPSEVICFHHLIERQVLLTPDSIALRAGEHSVTYSELDKRANQLAHHLKKLGVGPDILVGVLLERGIDMVVSFLATLKAGGAYVPIDTGFPEVRILHILKDTNARVLLTATEFASPTWKLGAEIICLDTDEASWNLNEVRAPTGDVKSSNLAYVIYTSGSTGLPKGVQIEHHSVVNFLESMKVEIKIDYTDRLLSVTSPSFDILGLEIYLPLIVGAQVILANSQQQKNTDSLKLLLAESTIMQATPSMWKLLIESGWKTKNTKLKMLCGGEKLSVELATQLKQRSQQIWNLYGPTETTIWSTLSKLESVGDEITIGRPILNTQIYILDSALNIAPIGSAGEIFIGGAGTARGYQNLESLTNERFCILKIFEKQIRLYKTGDLGRWLPDGSIQYLGRADFQVKVRGYRIELGEIESCLLSSPFLKQAVVMAKEDSGGEKQLIAYIIPKEGFTYKEEDLRNYLAKNLPNYMNPAFIIVLDKFPLMANGKVDGSSLLKISLAANTTTEIVQPRNQLESEILAIWRSLIADSKFGVLDEFFAVGGNSLSAARLSYKISKQFDISMTNSAVFEYRTVAQQAAYVEGKKAPLNQSKVPAEYWKQKLMGLSPLISFPTDFVRSQAQVFEKSKYSFSLPAELFGGVKQVASNESIDFFLVVAGVFAIFLSKHSGQDDVAFAFHIDKTDHSSILVLRILVSDDFAFPDLLKEIKKGYAEASGNKNISFDQIIKSIGPLEKAPHHPVVQVMLSEKLHPVEMSGLDCQLSFNTNGPDFSCNFEYNPNLYKKETVIRMSQRLRTLMEMLVSNPAAPIKNVNMLSEEEKFELAFKFNNGENFVKANDCVHTLFEQQAKISPEATALLFEGKSLTYRELNNQANQLAFYLRSLGLAPETLVGILVERSLEMVVGLLAILKAGGAYVPVDPSYPEERLNFLIADSKISLLLTLEKFHKQISAIEVRKIYLDQNENPWSQCSQDNLPLVSKSSDLAYVIYTSGSTGIPKGCCVPHIGISRLVIEPNYVHLDSTEVFVQSASVSFDAATFEIWGALLNGAKLVLMSPNTLSVMDIGVVVAKEKVTTLWLTSSLFNIMMEESPESLSGVKQLLVGGEELSVTHVHKALAYLKNTKLINGYGPTENTTFTTCYPIENKKYFSIPIGRPISGTQVYILDKNLNPVPIGVEGELYTSGLGLALGYLDRPELTAERFITISLFGRMIRVYKTGDLARWTDGGLIEYLGRRDLQVKIRGYRIELGEIETRLIECTQIKSGLVIVREEIPGDKLLVAFVVIKDGEILDSESIRQQLANQLPSYMIPSTFVELKSFPVTANGKIDRSAIEKTAAVSVSRNETVVLGNATESTIFMIWNDVIPNGNFGIQDDFFLVGGNSLSAVRLAARISKKFDVSVPIATLFRNRTIAKQAKFIDQKLIDMIENPDSALSNVQASILSVKHENLMQASFGQESLWFLDQIELEANGRFSSTYLIPLRFHIKGRLSVANLHRAMQALIDRHEQLRSYFVNDLGEPKLSILEKYYLNVVDEDFSDLEEPEKSTKVREYILKHESEGFDLGKANLFRAHLLRLSSKYHILSINMHHIISDGWSMEIILKDISYFYHCFVNGKQPELPRFEIQYSDFAVWQRQPEQQKSMALQLEYWGNHLADLPKLITFPTDRPRPLIQTFRGSHFPFVISKQVTAALNEIARKEGVTLFMTLSSIFSIFLSRYSSHEKVAFGFPVANRHLSEIEGLVGYFVNSVVLHIPLNNSASFSALLKKAKQICLEAYSNQEAPFERVVQALNPSLNQSFGRLIQVMLVLQNNESSDFTLHDLQVEREPSEVKISKFDLTLFLTEKNQELNGLIEFNSDIYDQSTIEILSERFQFLVTSIAENLDVAVKDIPWLNPRETNQLIGFIEKTKRVVLDSDGNPAPVGVFGTVYSCHSSGIGNGSDAFILFGKEFFLTSDSEFGRWKENGQIEKMESIREELPVLRRPEETSDSIDPVSKTEKAIFQVWKELMPNANFGILDDFFVVGGNSLLAVRLGFRLSKKFAIQIGSAQVFEHRTISALAIIVDLQLAADKSLLIPGMTILSRAKPLPLSHTQERIWIADHVEIQNTGKLPTTYLVPLSLKLLGRLDVEILKQAFADLVDRQESLRTLFVEIDGLPFQIVEPRLTFEMPLEDLTAFSKSRRQLRYDEVLNGNVNRGFNLSKLPLFRLNLLKMDVEEHVLFLNTHHIINDGWSLSVLLSELSSIYEARMKGKPNPLPQLHFQYADYAFWQRQEERETNRTNKLNYWKKQLEGIAPVLALPLDRPRPKIQTFNGQSHTLLISQQLLRSLKDLGEKEGATLFMTLAGAFSVFLGRHSGQNDVAFGFPVANRHSSEMEGIIGLFVNTLVLRTRLEDGLTFLELLKQIKRNCLDAYANEEVPFEQVVKAVNVERTQSYSPLFQVMMQIQDDIEEQISAENLRIQLIANRLDIAKFDLTLVFSEINGQLHASFGYNTDLFDSFTISRMSERFEILLNSIVMNPSKTLDQLLILTTNEEQDLETNFNKTAIEYDSSLTVQKLFEEQVSKVPESLALQCGGIGLTYAELDVQANHLAHHLKSLGIGPGVLVAVMLERSIELVVSFLAILKAGGAYVPLDTTLPAERLKHVLSDTNAPILITELMFADLADSNKVISICFERDHHMWSKGDGRALNSIVSSNDLAYVIYTSGSTGNPKGVQIEHRSVVNFLFSMKESPGIQPGDKLLSVTSPSFDILGLEIYLPLSVGAQVILASREEQQNGEALKKMLKTASIMQATPSTWKLLLDSNWSVTNPTLKILCGGEKLSIELAESLQTRSSQLWNMFGPTETTIWSTLDKVYSSDKQITIGRPIKNTQIFILDNSKNPSPIGVVGEMYIAGDGLARGYQNLPEQTVEKFSKISLFGKMWRVYKTGDLARWLPDGRLQYFGRSDFQVKIRGYRIELGEIETSLAKYEEVSQVIVMAREDAAEELHLVAFVIPRVKDKFNEDQARHFLAAILPSYMIPSFFVSLNSFPLLANGKVDSKSLLLNSILDNKNREIREPTNETEATILAIWKDLIPDSKFGVLDDFFHVGGSSLTAVRLGYKILKKFGVEMTNANIFENRTVAEQANFITSFSGKKVEFIPVTNPVIQRRGLMACSFGQERLWFLDQLESQNKGRYSSTYLMPFTFQIGGNVKVDYLHEALKQIVQRHEVLRSSFVELDGQPMVSLLESADLKMPFFDLSHLVEPLRQEQLNLYLKKNASEGFDLALPLLFRVSLIKMADMQFVLLMNLHHILGDGWSIEILIRELGSIYESLTKGHKSALPDLPIQYADFATWQRSDFQKNFFEPQLKYWQAQLQGAPPLLSLPLDYPRPAIQTYSGDVAKFKFSADTSHAIKLISQKSGVTIFMTLASAFGVFLSRHTGQNDIAIGFPVANRNRVEIEGIVGLFINTLVLRLELESEFTFAELLKQVRKRCLDAFSNQEVPFEQVVQRINPERSQAYSPLFQVMLQYQEASSNRIAFDDLSIQPIDSQMNVAKFDLSLSISESGGLFAGAFVYNTDLFNPQTIERFCRRFEILVANLVSDSTESIFKTGLLPATEIKELQYTFNNTKAYFHENVCVHQLFETQAELTPNSVALEFGKNSITYAELNLRSSQLAEKLQDDGVGPDILVGVFLQRSIDMVIAFLAVLKAGGAYVPLDPMYPEGRLKHILEDIQAPVLLSSSELVDRIPKSKIKIYRLDKDQDCWLKKNGKKLSRQANSSHLAYVIYTSGSTGLPKGVQVEHRSVVNLLSSVQSQPGLTASDIFLSLTSPSFDILGVEIYLPLIVGAKVVLCSREDQTNGENIQKLMKNATFMQATPSSWKLLIESGWQGSKSSIKAITAGEPLTLDLSRQLRSKTKELWNLYGPTETTIYSTGKKINDSDSHITIGYPIQNTEVFILDKELQSAPIGVYGELFIGGAGLARGYLNRPELTEERFLDLTLFDKQKRLYKTGDLARWLPDGQIEYAGRTDFQVKVRGYRIELGEIESKLQENPTIQNALVLAKNDQWGEKTLIAYVVSKPLDIFDPEGLRAFLAKALPDYMIPSFFVSLPHFPLMVNGKIDRSALEKVSISESSAREVVLPRSPMEVDIFDTWKNLIADSKFGVLDDFFAVGGNSLSAVRLASQLTRKFKVPFGIALVFSFRTISAQAKYLESVRDQNKMALNSIPRVKRESHMPTSFGQERLWFLDQLETQNTGAGPLTYLVPLTISFRGTLNVACLHRALRALVQRHEILRTYFVHVEGKPYQSIVDELDFQIPFIDLIDISPDKKDLEIQRLVRSNVNQGFDLSVLPLFRFAVVRKSNQDHILLMNKHHIISDGWSIDVILNELTQFYRTFLKGDSKLPPPLLIQYADFSAWQNGSAQAEVFDRQISYWQSQLEGLAPLLNLPVDRTRPAIQTFKGSRHSFTISPIVSKKMKDISRQQGATLFMTMATAFSVFLSRHCGQNDIAFGTPVANRGRTELESLIGLFINTLVIRVDLKGSVNFLDLLERVKRTCIDAYSNQEVPFEKIVQVLNPARSQAYSPLFQVLMLFTDNVSIPHAVEDLEIELRESPSDVAKFDLTLAIGEHDGELKGSFGYNTDLFDKGTIARMSDRFEVLLQSISEDVNLPVDRLSIMTSKEKTLVLEEFNDNKIAYDLETPIHHLFEQQVARSPLRVATVDDFEILTYAELNQRANVLAKKLKHLGVGPNTLVALLLDRSVNLMVAILAILKAGGAYLPLNLKDPNERLQTVLRDSGAIITLINADWAVEKIDEASDTFDLRNLPQNTDTIENLPPTAIKSDIAYCIYTSGSTGVPNGVLIEHEAAVNRLFWMRDELKITEDDVILQKTPYSFDVSVWELFLPLILGAKQVMLKSGGESDPFIVKSAIVEHKVTLLHFVPPMLNIYLSAVEGGWESVRYVVCSGEALDPELVAKFFKNVGHSKPELHNYYGPTEAAVDVSRCRVVSGSASVTIGSPAPNNRFYILDSLGQICPVGVCGELWIAGIQLGRGYLNRPQKTAEKYIPDPFHQGERMYDTGDLAKWLPNGEVFYLGRKDSQVKIRGYRIELSEIEIALSRCEQVAHAVVLVQRHGGASDFLTAFVKMNGEASIEKLRIQAAKLLPEYMVPSHYVFVENFPINSSGKVDRKALSKITVSITAAKQNVPPTHKTEQIILEIWQKLLPSTSAGITDDFFEVGGNSLTAVQLGSRVSKQFNIFMGIAAVFKYRTVQAQALFVNAESDVLNAKNISLHAVARKSLHNLSSAQERMWFLYRLDEESSAYHIRFFSRMEGKLNERLFGDALALLARRQEVLRTTYLDQGGQAFQVPNENLIPSLRIEDLTKENEPELRMQILAEEVAEKPFNLEIDSPLRAILFKNGVDQYHLLIILHHIAGDGLSMQILLDEWSAIYSELVSGKASGLQPMPIQYIDYVESLLDTKYETTIRESITYWTDRLKNIPILELPTDSNLDKSKVDFKTPSFELSEKLTAELKSLAMKSAATPFEILMCATSLLLSRLSNQNDIAIGFPIANRQYSEVETMIGLFLNTLVLRTDLNNDPSFSQLLVQVSANIRDAYEHQQVPFEKLVQELNPARRLDRTPIFDVLFNYLGTMNNELQIEKMRISGGDLKLEVKAKYAITLYVSESQKSLRFNLVFRRDLFSQERAESIMTQLYALIQQVIEKPDLLCSQFSLLAEPERIRVLQKISTPVDHPHKKAVVELILENARANPMAVAVEQGPNQLLYSQLSDRIDTLARMLLTSGSRAEDVVMISGPRGIGFVVGMLAIFRAGLVMFPVNPLLPVKRRQLLRAIANPVRAVIIRQDGYEGSSEEDFTGLPCLEIESDSGQPVVGKSVEVILLPEIQPTAPAYIFFTSGTTGQPRGILGQHGSLRHFMDWQKQTFEISKSDRCAQLTNVSFDVMLRDTLLALVAGGTLVVPLAKEETGGHALIQWLDSKQITVMHAAPTVFQTWMLDAPKDVGLLQLRWLFLAGEPLPATVIERFKKLFASKARIVNLYGPTETTMAKFAYKVPHEPLPSVIPVGFPLPQCQGFIMRGNVFCGIGESGEVVIRTPFRTLGYIGANSNTGGFVANPFVNNADDLIYRTGDMGRLLPDGAIEVIGRLDFQVKISGLRIQPAEIESTISGYSAVSACVVVPYQDRVGESRLVAYIVTSIEKEKIVEQLRSFLAQHLPQAMIPGQFVKIDKLPVTPNGKVDRAALPKPEEIGRSVLHREEPRTNVEKEILAIWTEVLQCIAGRTENFFELGGTSLKILRLHFLLNIRFPSMIRVAQLFSSPTIAQQAMLIEDHTGSSSDEGGEIHEL